ncbi:hypothetical protein AB0346_00765 [Nocardia beijingensis]|uniref:hypothetical protein n=1 Tax=Nocardia beijingensis TaxID=95162 RepID=UPI00344D4F2D
MIAIADRARQQEFTAYAAADTLAPVWERVERLLTRKRPIVYVEQWLTSTAVTVLTSLAVDDTGIMPGARYWRRANDEGFAVALTSGVGLGTCAHRHEGNESDAALRFINDRRAATRIHVQGFGHGRDDHLQITTYNARGVGVHRAVYFADAPVDGHAQRDALLLASCGDWSSGALAELATRFRDCRQPAATLPSLLAAHRA